MSSFGGKMLLVILLCNSWVDDCIVLQCQKVDTLLKSLMLWLGGGVLGISSLNTQQVILAVWNSSDHFTMCAYLERGTTRIKV